MIRGPAYLGALVFLSVLFLFRSSISPSRMTVARLTSIDSPPTVADSSMDSDNNAKYFEDLPPRFEYLNDVYKRSLEQPCKTDYYFDHWFGLTSRMNIYAFVLMDTLLANKTMAVHPLAFVDGKKRLGQFATKTLLRYFENEEFPICYENNHKGKFMNDQSHLRTWPKVNMTYQELFDVQTSILLHMVRNVRAPIQRRAQKQLQKLSRPFYSVQVRWGDKVRQNEAKKTELEVYLNAVQKLGKPENIHMMTIEENVTQDFQERSGIPTINLYDDLIVELLVAAQADHVVCTESSNICRVLWKLRRGKNMTNVESRPNPYPIRFWLVDYTKDRTLGFK